MRVVPVYQPGDSRWGLESLVNMIEHAAKAIRRQYPESQLSVGHLSRPGGGEIDRHASHESGRDADIGFYVRNQQGKTIYADHFVPFKGDGTAPSWPGAQFDDAKNWALVNSIVNDGNARVTHIFVASPIRARLLQYAEKIGAPAAARTRAAELMAQPRGALPHDDHFHVRIACPPGSTNLATNKCVEIPLPHHRSSPLAKAAHSTKPKLAAKPKPAPSKSTPASEPEESESKEDSKESFLPSLAPAIPGLDTAIIPKPLALPSKPEAKKPADAAPEPPPPIRRSRRRLREPLSVPTDAERGVALLREGGCLNCHSTDGSSKVGPTFRGLWGRKQTVMRNGVPRDIVVDEAYLAQSLRDPDADIAAGYKAGTMPKTSASDEDVPCARDRLAIAGRAQ